MVGYARVSTDEQKTQRQVDELVMAGVAAMDIFSDTGTGAHMDRPGWEYCAKDLQPGDILVIHSLDRLSRDLVHTMTTLKELNDRGVTVRVLTMDFDSRTPMGRFVFSMMAAFAQFEREVILERTAHGLAKARERGVIGGAVKKYTDEAIGEAYRIAGTVEKAAKRLGCSQITVKRGLASLKAKEAANAERIKDS
jgi:DNA invertase Pin-like site-specific DNA recombinase